MSGEISTGHAPADVYWDIAFRESDWEEICQIARERGTKPRQLMARYFESVSGKQIAQGIRELFAGTAAEKEKV